VVKTLERYATEAGETITHVRIGRYLGIEEPGTPEAALLSSKEGEVFPWDVGRDLVSHVQLSQDYGSAETWDVTAWSESHVYVTEEYDGRTSINRISRHPQRLYRGAK
jgi:hypothetical protein